MANDYKLSIEVEVNGRYEIVEVDKVYPTFEKARAALGGQLRKYDRKEMCARGTVVPV